MKHVERMIKRIIKGTVVIFAPGGTVSKVGTAELDPAIWWTYYLKRKYR